MGARAESEGSARGERVGSEREGGGGERVEGWRVSETLHERARRGRVVGGRGRGEEGEWWASGGAREWARGGASRGRDGVPPLSESFLLW